MPLNLFDTIVQKSQKWPKTQIKGGPALNRLKASAADLSRNKPRIKPEACGLGFYAWFISR